MIPRVETRWSCAADATAAIHYLTNHDAGLRALLHGLMYGGLMDYRAAYERVFAYVAHQCTVAPPAVTFPPPEAH